MPQLATDLFEPDPTRVQDRLNVAQGLLASVGSSDVSRDGDVLRFSATHWSRLVELSFSVHPSGRWGFVNRRVKYDPDQLEGSPSGTVNLLYAVNAFNRAQLGARLRIADGEFHFDRPVSLIRRATTKRLAVAVEALLRGSFAGIDALKPIREGTNWFEGTRSLVPARDESDAQDLTEIQQRLREVELEARREDEALICEPHGAEVRFASCRGDLHATQLTVASKSPRSSVKLKLGESVPACEALVNELNRVHAETPCTLFWNPKVGVVSRLTVCAFSCRKGDFRLLFETLARTSTIKTIARLTESIKA